MKDDADKIADQVRDLIKFATEQAEEAIWQDTKRLAEIAFGADYDCMFLCIPGVDAKPADAPALTIHVRDLNTGEVLFSHDPVLDLVDSYGDDPDTFAKKADEAVAALEAGIKRLRDEAERLKAQS